MIEISILQEIGNNKNGEIVFSDLINKINRNLSDAEVTLVVDDITSAIIQFNDSKRFYTIYENGKVENLDITSVDDITHVYAWLYETPTDSSKQILVLSHKPDYVEEGLTLVENSNNGVDIGNVEYTFIGEKWEGTVPWWTNNSSGNSNIIEVKIVDRISPISLAGFFFYLNNLTSIDGLEKLSTSRVSNMSGAFEECWELKNLDLSGFNTSNVTDMNYMFYDCSNLVNLNVSKFNTEKVTNMAGMFYDCTEIESLDVSNFNTENVKSMNAMFCDCVKLCSLNLKSFDTKNVIDTYMMFAQCTSLTELNILKFDTSNITNMKNMLYEVPTSIKIKTNSSTKIWLESNFPSWAGNIEQ